MWCGTTSETPNLPDKSKPLNFFRHCFVKGATSIGGDNASNGTAATAIRPGTIGRIIRSE